MDEQNVSEIGQGVLLSLSTLGRELGVHRQTVAKRLSDAGIRPAGEKGGHALWRLRDAIQACQILTAGAVSDPAALPPMERRAWYQSERERTALDREQGALVPVDEVREQLALVLKITSQMLETLPDRLERDGALAPSALPLVEQAIDAVRAEWAVRLETSEA